MSPRSTARRRLVGAAALAATVPLVLAGCSGGGGGGSSSGGDPTTITVTDYYNEGNDDTVIGDTLTKCGESLGVTIERTSIPGSSLIQKVLQQASSKTLPDVLMLDNPDLQQIAATGALAPLEDFGISTDGYAKGVVDAGTYEGKTYGLAPTVNTIALFYNKAMLADAGSSRPPPGTS
ncbi:Bacterial extracellular solute-binding protein [Clavibacter michiganensis subsp. michiganensis]|uniref:Bacterial extracellular solute-binding protein n=1 Tax=Clavibacter michiganensis subsp. michiganensis TaxID=33013 RepID=A0A251XNN9_CLAMM|nr:Bacterial extracellular solute-binding protein [Clavibacter michiganensis subsp. michiganensis]OUE04809.1 Bacterial extracellular solute-binding protein [Clavibacter michiganensis subsp. michiganensis]